jgi:hypothetical protein
MRKGEAAEKKRPRYTFAALPVGTEIARCSVVITVEMIEAYWQGMPKALRRTTDIPLAVWDQETMNAVTERWDIRGALQARTRWFVRRPTEIGESLELVCYVKEAFLRRERPVIMIRTEVRAGNEEVGWMEHEHVVEAA